MQKIYNLFNFNKVQQIFFKKLIQAMTEVLSGLTNHFNRSLSDLFCILTISRQEELNLCKFDFSNTPTEKVQLHLDDLGDHSIRAYSSFIV